MTYFVRKFTHRSALALCAMLAPFAAAAELEEPILIISSNTPEKVAAIEPVLIDRSGLSVAPVDLHATGGITAEAAMVAINTSKRPMTREGATILAGAQPLPVGTHLAETSKSTRTGPLRATANSVSRQAGQAQNRQLPSSSRAGSRRTAPSAAPSYLLGVFR